jgi:hypothetical protein
VKQNEAKRFPRHKISSFPLETAKVFACEKKETTIKKKTKKKRLLCAAGSDDVHHPGDINFFNESLSSDWKR